MKLSERLISDHISGDFGKALEGYPQQALLLEAALLESCDELEAYINAEYPEHMRNYPHNRRKYRSEMAEIKERRKIIEGF